MPDDAVLAPAIGDIAIGCDYVPTIARIRFCEASAEPLIAPWISTVGISVSSMDETEMPTVLIQGAMRGSAEASQKRMRAMVGT